VAANVELVLPSGDGWFGCIYRDLEGKDVILGNFFFPQNCELAGGVAAKGAQAFKKTSATKAITCWSTVHRRLAFVCV
jgi:hypothetical protein